MAITTAKEIIDDVSIILLDAGNVRWTRPELFGWVNDAQIEIAVLRPSAYVKSVDFELSAGTKQAIPSDGTSFVDVVRNIDGMAVTKIDRAILDSQSPNWHAMSGARDKVFHYCHSSKEPKRFYVYPPSVGGNVVELIYNAIPERLKSENSALMVDDIFANAIVDYVAYRALSKDSEASASQNDPLTHYRAFVFSVTGKTSGGQQQAAASA